MLDQIKNELTSHQNIVEDVIQNLQRHIYTVSIIIDETIKRGNKIFIFGNGNSILTVQYLVSKFYLNRGFNAISLVQNSAIVTSIANNYDYDLIFSKQIELLAKEGDLLIGISSSGNSKNVLRGLSLGQNLGCRTVGLSGYDGGCMSEFCDVNLIVPSDNMSRIEELHMVIGNIIAS